MSNPGALTKDPAMSPARISGKEESPLWLLFWEWKYFGDKEQEEDPPRIELLEDNTDEVVLNLNMPRSAIILEQ